MGEATRPGDQARSPGPRKPEAKRPKQLKKGPSSPNGLHREEQLGEGKSAPPLDWRCFGQRAKHCVIFLLL